MKTKVVLWVICIAQLVCSVALNKPRLIQQNETEIAKEEVIVDTVIQKDLTPLEFIYEKAQSLKIKHSDIFLAQCVLETAHFTSNLFVENNNIAGMKHPDWRSVTSIGPDENGNAKYQSVEDAVIDYALWQSNALKLQVTRDEFLAYLDKRYAEDPQYASKVTRIAASLKSKLGI